MFSCSTMAKGGSHVFKLNNGQGRQSCIHVQQWPREAFNKGLGRQPCLHVKQWPREAVMSPCSTMAKGRSHIFMFDNGQWPREAVMSSC